MMPKPKIGGRVYDEINILVAGHLGVVVQPARRGGAGKTRQGRFSDIVQPRGAGAVQPRRCYAAFFLVSPGSQSVHGGERDRPGLRDGSLGHRHQPTRQPAGGRSRSGGAKARPGLR